MMRENKNSSNLNKPYIFGVSALTIIAPALSVYIELLVNRKQTISLALTGNSEPSHYSIHQRQFHIESCSFALLGFKPYLSLCLFNNSFAHGKPEAGAG